MRYQKVMRCQAARKNSYHRKDGGGLGAYPITKGSGSEGRLELGAVEKKKNTKVTAKI